MPNLVSKKQSIIAGSLRSRLRQSSFLIVRNCAKSLLEIREHKSRVDRAQEWKSIRVGESRGMLTFYIELQKDSIDLRRAPARKWSRGNSAEISGRCVSQLRFST